MNVISQYLLDSHTRRPRVCRASQGETRPSFTDKTVDWLHAHGLLPRSHDNVQTHYVNGFSDHMERLICAWLYHTDRYNNYFTTVVWCKTKIHTDMFIQQIDISVLVLMSNLVINVEHTLKPLAVIFVTYHAISCKECYIVHPKVTPQGFLLVFI